MFRSQTTNNTNTFGGEEAYPNGGLPEPMKDLLDGVLPEASGYDDPIDDVTFHLNIASHTSHFMTSLQRDDDFLGSGVVDPNEVLLPPLEDLGNLSLDDTEDLNHLRLDSHDASLHLNDEPLDLDSYLGEPKDIMTFGGDQGFSHDSYSTSTDSSIVVSDAYSFGCVHNPNHSVASTSSEGYATMPFGGHDYSTSLKPQQRHSPETFQLHQNYSTGLQFSQKYLTPPIPLQSYKPDTRLEQYDYSANPSDLFHPSNQSQYIPEASGIMQQQSTFQLTCETDVSSSNTKSTSRKGYKHRHERVYGLPEAEQQKRSQVLNNEASQLYRERKSKKQKQIETQEKQEEERKKKLLRQYKKLHQKVELYQRVLNQQHLLQPPNPSTPN